MPRRNRPNQPLQSALDQLQAHWAAGDRRAALKLAASWPQLGNHRDAIQRAWAATQSPDLYREMGYDPEALKQEGYAALQARYSLA